MRADTKESCDEVMGILLGAKNGVRSAREDTLMEGGECHEEE